MHTRRPRVLQVLSTRGASSTPPLPGWHERAPRVGGPGSLRETGRDGMLCDLAVPLHPRCLEVQLCHAPAGRVVSLS